jgi:hypothetical protein
MDNLNNLLRILQESEDVKPVLTDKNGTEIYSFNDAVKKASTDILTNKLSPSQKVEPLQINQDGQTYRRSRKDYPAVDKGFFENRYRKMVSTKGGVKYANFEVVVDFRACREQEKGQVYSDNIVTYIFNVVNGEKEEGLKVELTGMKYISAQEFISKFKERLDVDSMKHLHALIEAKSATVPESTLSI